MYERLNISIELRNGVRMASLNVNRAHLITAESKIGSNRVYNNGCDLFQYEIFNEGLQRRGMLE